MAPGLCPERGRQGCAGRGLHPLRRVRLVGVSETERVTMVWPAELKAALRERVGQRGMTQFVVAAVAAAMAAPAESPVEAPPTPPTPPPVDLQDGEDLHTPLFMTGKKPDKPAESAQQPAEQLPHDRQSPDLFKRLREQVPGLKPASEILRRVEPTEPPAVGDLMREVQEPLGHVRPPVAPPKPRAKKKVEPEPTPEPTPEPSGPLATCATCGAILEDGACWECF